MCMLWQLIYEEIYHTFCHTLILMCYSLSRSRVAAANARVRKSVPVTPLDEDLSVFHKELMETCVDMLARYTFSTRANIPKRQAQSLCLSLPLSLSLFFS